MRRWLGRATIATWLVLGAVAIVVVPEDDTPSPELATELFGSARSMQSAAPDGVLAFARVLERLGFGVGANRRVGAPEGDVLFLLAPVVPFTEAEVEALLGWVRGGGHLVYASPAHTFEIEGETVEHAVDDAMLLGLRQAVGSATATLTGRGLPLGSGRAVVLADRGAALSNERIAAVGLRQELDWLRPILAGRTQVRFDEGRIGTAPQENVLELIRRSRFWPSVWIGGLALALGFWGRLLRRRPADLEPSVVGRAYAEHLSAVAHVLQSSHRLRLAGQALREGTRRRLGTLARTPKAMALLDEAPPTSTKDLVHAAEALRRLEEELGVRP